MGFFLYFNFLFPTQLNDFPQQSYIFVKHLLYHKILKCLYHVIPINRQITFKIRCLIIQRNLRCLAVGINFSCPIGEIVIGLFKSLKDSRKNYRQRRLNWIILWHFSDYLYALIPSIFNQIPKFFLCFQNLLLK